MGWPPCYIEGCDGWPSVGHTGVCAECIKDPAKVRLIADRHATNRIARDEKARLKLLEVMHERDEARVMLADATIVLEYETGGVWTQFEITAEARRIVTEGL